MKPWVAFEELPGCSIFPWPHAWFGWTRGIRKYIGQTFSEGIFLSQNGSGKHVYRADEAERMAKATIERARDQAFVQTVEEDTHKAIEQVHAFCQRLPALKLKNVSNAELASVYEEANHLIEEIYSVGLVPSTMDMHHNAFSNMLLKYIEARGKEQGLGPEEIGEAYAALTTVEKKTLTRQQEEDFLKMVTAVQKNRVWTELVKSGRWRQDSQLNEKIEDHARKYGWLSRGYEGKVTWTTDYFAELLKSEVRQQDKTDKKILNLEATRKSLLGKRRGYEKRLALNQEFSHFFEVARRFTILKNERKDAVLWFYFMLDSLIREIARRLNVTEKQARYILPKEMRAALVEGKVNSSELNERQELCYVLVTKDDTQIFKGRPALELLEFLEKDKKEIKELKGQCACPGFARGIVRIINRVTDVSKMGPGNILVSHATEPSLVPAMRNASAIVTDQGGITSHAAIVSRELGIPCVIGTKVATQALKDGDEAEVDATKGIVRKIS